MERASCGRRRQLKTEKALQEEFSVKQRESAKTRLLRPQRPVQPRPLGGGVDQRVPERTRWVAPGAPTPRPEQPSRARSVGQLMKHSSFLGIFYHPYDCCNLIAEIFLNPNSEKTQG